MIILLIISAWIIASFLTTSYVAWKGGKIKSHLDFTQGNQIAKTLAGETLVAILVLPCVLISTLITILSKFFRAIKNN